MKLDFDDYEILTLRWADLTEKVMLERALDRDEFISLFGETFEAIKKHSVAPKIDRDLMDLVMNVGGFVATRLAKINYWHIAAVELTEAMLHCCLYEESHKEVISKGEWYTICEVTLDFTNPEEMLYMLAQDFENWDEIAQEEI